MVFVLSHDRQPLDPTTHRRAGLLLKKGRAAVFRRFPFTIILKDRLAAESVTHDHRLKLDPGSKTTGIAVVAEATGRVVWAAELTHRGQAIRDALLSRRAIRRSRHHREEGWYLRRTGGRPNHRQLQHHHCRRHRSGAQPSVLYPSASGRWLYLPRRRRFLPPVNGRVSAPDSYERKPR